MFFPRTLCAHLVFAVGICFPAFGQQTTPVFGAVRTAEDQAVKLTTVSIEGPGGCCSSVTTDTGQFNFSVPPLEIGFPYIFHVEGWVVIDPCVLARGRVYLPNPKAEKIAIRVLTRGDSRIKTKSIACILVQEASRIKPQAAITKGPRSMLQTTSSAILARILRPPLPLRRMKVAHVVETAYHAEAPQNKSQAAAVEPASDQLPVDTFVEKQAQELGLTAQELASAIDQWSRSTSDSYQKGLAAFHQGRYVEARQYLSDSVKSPGGDIIEHYVPLGRAEFETGHYAAAEAALRKVLAVHKDDPLVLTNLGLVLSEEYRDAEAEPLLKRALSIDEQNLGHDHPDVAEDLRNLADLYFVQKKYAESEQLISRAIAIDEKKFGRDDSHPAKMRAFLGLLHFWQGKTDAEPILKESLAIDEKVLGPDHPALIEMLFFLANVHLLKEEFTDAEPLLKRALALHEKAFGRDHPDRAIFLLGLAAVYLNQNKLADAQPLVEQARDLQVKGLGRDHPLIVVTDIGLAEIYLAQHRLTEAESLFKQALPVWERLIGPDRPDVASVLFGLATVYRLEEKCGEAVPLLKRTLTILEKATYRVYQDMAAGSAEQMAICLHNLGRDAEAKPYEEQAAKIRAKLSQEAQDTPAKKP